MNTANTTIASAQNLNLEFLPELLNEVESRLIEPGWDGSAVLTDSIPADLIVGTHNGVFHADEVLALALLRLGQPDLRWVRTRDADTLAGTLRIDVGEGLLDHHGNRAEAGVAACSRVYTLLSQSGAIPEWAQPVLTPIVTVVAAWDTGDDSAPHPLPYVHALQEAATATGGNMDSAFEQALEMVERHLRALLTAAEARAEATRIAQAEIDNQADLLVVEFQAASRAADVKQLLHASGHPALYYVSPESVSDWRVLCCAPQDAAYSPFASKALLPERFRGLRGAALAEAAGLPADCGIFCHAAGFIAGFTTREAAVAFANLCAEEVK